MNKGQVSTGQNEIISYIQIIGKTHETTSKNLSFSFPVVSKHAGFAEY